MKWERSLWILPLDQFRKSQSLMIKQLAKWPPNKKYMLPGFHLVFIQYLKKWPICLWPRSLLLQLDMVENRVIERFCEPEQRWRASSIARSSVAWPIWSQHNHHAYSQSTLGGRHLLPAQSVGAPAFHFGHLLPGIQGSLSSLAT